ncbi:MAG: VOC family protein [Methylocella sp.]
MLGVDDLERAVKFYRDGLGFPLAASPVTSRPDE